MYGFQVGYTLRVVVKEPAGEFQDGEFVGADEHHFILNVCAHTPAAHWVYIPQGNISRIIKFFPQPVTLGSSLYSKSAVEMGSARGM